MHKDRESPYISTLLAMSYFIGMRREGKGEHLKRERQKREREREKKAKQETSNSIKNCDQTIT